MKLEKLFLKWVNHTKEGSRRSSLDITDEIWKQVIKDFRNWENSEDKEVSEHAKRLLYTGKIRRVHLDLNEVDYDNHYVSWTLVENLEDLYFFNPAYSHTIITAEATKDNPAISFIGYLEFLKKFEGEDLVTPPIRKEKEVIFPLQEKSILSIEKIEIKKR
ncbi:hypothetical protein ABE28_023985 (plasmid) [Peribacillus muralis]|uniref:Uncharacterized protein n=1 Tax=Peribacillus muralis TaxID=264697 RepID=A0A1B3XW35_9BACI|nr:hypothetical protein [Peribacillus muralis]AOH57411.1 hypothetical protein ABE28_023985 [Peribacillus muralis]